MKSNFVSASLFSELARVVLFVSCFALCGVAQTARAANGPEPLDGVNVEAIETYQNPKTQQIDFGLSILPLNPYYNAFGINLAYNYYFGKTWAWQVIDVDYVYTVDTGLTSQLAEFNQTNPRHIERLNFMVSSDVQYVAAYGKFIFAKQYIRYFRSALLLGPTFASSDLQGAVGFNVGWRFEVFVNEAFSWVVQARDIYIPGNIGNNLAFVLSTSYAF